MRCLVDVGAVAHVYVHYPTGRRQQERPQRRCPSRVVPDLVEEGASHLCIESSGPEADMRDRVVLLDALNPDSGAAAMSYGWRTKTEPALWLADAVFGAAADFLLGFTREAPLLPRAPGSGRGRRPPLRGGLAAARARNERFAPPSFAATVSVESELDGFRL